MGAALTEGGAPDGPAFQVGVRRLGGHAEGERDVGEVDVGGRLVLVEVDAAVRARVIQGGVAEREEGVTEEPGQPTLSSAMIGTIDFPAPGSFDAPPIRTMTAARLPMLARTSRSSASPRLGYSRVA